MASKLPGVTAAPIPLLDTVRFWECPEIGCQARKRTTEPGNIQPMHPCRARDGLEIPFQPADRYGVTGARHRIVLIERGDYIGREVFDETDNGARGVMAVHAYRPDGSHDTVVSAAAANPTIGAHQV